MGLQPTLYKKQQALTSVFSSVPTLFSGLTWVSHSTVTRSSLSIDLLIGELRPSEGLRLARSPMEPLAEPRLKPGWPGLTAPARGVYGDKLPESQCTLGWLWCNHHQDRGSVYYRRSQPLPVNTPQGQTDNHPSDFSLLRLVLSVFELHKRRLTQSVLSRVASSVNVIVFKIHPCCCICQKFILWYHRIVSHGWIDHRRIHSPVDGRSGSSPDLGC